VVGEANCEERVARAIGLLASGLGLLLVSAGAPDATYAGPVGELGLVFGAFGYALGASRLGGGVMIVSVRRRCCGHDGLGTSREAG
jgi:hypothetical protein